MSKYILKNMDRGTEAEYNSLSAVKQAFIDASKTFKNLSVTESKNDELFVSLLDGVTHPGKHYRRFAQRGLVKPKETRAAAEPTPLSLEAQYLDSQAKWLADNHIKQGDKIKVVRMADELEYWPNAWTDRMDAAVGNEYEFVEADRYGIMLKDGLRGPIVWGFQYPYFVLEKVTTVKDVCRDVIAQLNAKRYHAAKGLFIKESSLARVRQACDYDYETSLQEVLLKKAPVCDVCAKGGLLLSFVRLKNNVTVGQLDILGEGGYDLRTKHWPAGSLELFGRELLDEIEMAFEIAEYSWTSKEIKSARRRELVRKYYHIDDPDQRLIRIMQDIIDDKF